jgi:hypothetical protein
MNKKRILIILGLIILAGAITIYLEWNKPHRDIKDASGIQTTAANLYKQLTTDSEYHKAALINKVVIVSGKVSHAQSNQKGQPIILLETGVPGASVNCTLEENIQKSIKTGDTISVKGICSGYISGEEDMGLPGDVYMIRCYVLPKNNKRQL